MSTTRAVNARHVRQRKLNTKSGLRIIRENEIDDAPEDESQRHIPQVETGVEKGEEVEFHLQAAINAASAAALGAKAAKQNYIPTPDAVKAQDVKYDELYPKSFKDPATYIRFSSTVEDSVGLAYCMSEEDSEFLAQLNDGKDVDGQPRKDKLGQCTEDVFEEAVTYLEELSNPLQPFAVDNVPLLPLEELTATSEATVSAKAQKWLRPVYQYWVRKKAPRPMMPAIKVRMLDTSSDADDADPYVCFRRREVRQTRKTRGRDAQVVEKLKKLRLELEQARHLVQAVAQREQLNKESLEVSRKVFEQRKQLKEVKVTKNIIGEKGEDEELLVNQKPAPKPKTRQDTNQRPPTIRIRSGGDRPPENDLIQLSEIQLEAVAQVQHTIESRKEQHKRWNQQWIDETWRPITPPLDSPDEQLKWAPLVPPGASYPTPPPTLHSEGSQEREDVEMQDRPFVKQEEVIPNTAPALPQPEIIFHVPGAFPVDTDEQSFRPPKREAAPACRLRYGRGGRCFLETKRRKLHAVISRDVVSDSESEDEDDGQDCFAVDPQKIFDYRCNIHPRNKVEINSGERRRWSNDDQSSGTAQANQTQQSTASAVQQTPAGGVT